MSLLLPWAIGQLAKFPQSTMTFGTKLFSMQLSNIFCNPWSVWGWSSQTSERKKKCKSGSSFWRRTANWAWDIIKFEVRTRKCDRTAYVFKQRRGTSTKKVNMAVYWSADIQISTLDLRSNVTNLAISRGSHGGWPIAMISSVPSSVYSPSTNAKQPSVNSPSPGWSY